MTLNKNNADHSICYTKCFFVRESLCVCDVCVCVCVSHKMS